MVFFIVCEWLYNMNLCMRVIMYIINLFLCCVCFVIIWYVCVTTVFSFLNVYNKLTNKHHEWFLQTPKAMWSIVVKTFVHISE